MFFDVLKSGFPCALDFVSLAFLQSSKDAMFSPREVSKLLSAEEPVFDDFGPFEPFNDLCFFLHWSAFGFDPVHAQ